MKSFFTLSFVFLFSILGAQSISNSQKTLITKRTATWCPNCGTWGWDFAKAIENLSTGYGVLVRAHHSGDLQSTVAQDITENFNAVYQPEFYVNEVRQDVGSTTWEDKLGDFETAINGNAESPSIAQFTIASSIENDAVNVNATIEFLNAAEGEYYFGVYLLEDSIVNNQSSLGPNTVHNNVLRAAFTDDSFGEKVGEGSIPSGTVFNAEYSLSPEGDDVMNRFFDILVILWKKEDESYKVENLHSAALGATTHTIESKEIENTKIFQSNKTLNVQFELLSNAKDGVLELFALDGRRIIAQKVQLSSGFNHIQTDMSQFLRPEIVIVKLSDSKKIILSEKVLIAQE